MVNFARYMLRVVLLAGSADNAAPGTSVLKIKAALDAMREALRADMTSLGEAGV